MVPRVQSRKPVINLLPVRYFMSKLDKYLADHCYSVACNHCWLNCGRTVSVISPSDQELYLLEVVASLQLMRKKMRI